MKSLRILHKIVRELKKSSASVTGIRSLVKKVSMYNSNRISIWKGSTIIMFCCLDIQLVTWEYLKNGEEWSAHSEGSQVKNEASHTI